MKNKFTNLLFIVALLVSLSACHKDEVTIVEPEGIDEATLATNQWIKETMDMNYFWRAQMPSIDETQEADPFAYFDKLLYVPTDRWSWITDDYSSLFAELIGEPVTMGIGADAYWVDETRVTVCFVVNYVFPGSAADEAGLKRGDIILQINHANITEDNYSEFSTGESFSVQLAEVRNGSLTTTGESLDLVARVTTTDPAIYHKVLNVEGSKIGYLVYVEFLTGANNQFLDHLAEIFDEFKAEGITDLVVDLRYNPGGEIDAATYLASAIAPFAVVDAEEPLVNMQYNSIVQSIINGDDRYASLRSYNFDKDAPNIDMSSVYFLTTPGTASASELVITGLSPYMDVVQVGESTHGKYTGAWVMPDDNEEWCMQPIVMKYANIDGYTDFADGLDPDYVAVDYPTLGLQFGDMEDPVLATAINLITGVSTTSTLASKSARIQLKHGKLKMPAQELKSNLIVPVDKGLLEMIK